MISSILRTAQSMTAFQQRGGTVESKRALILIERYETQRAALAAEDWAALCALLGCSEQHTGYDFWA